ncbi:MAG: hypothetical protein ACREF3_18045 [Acetobacteraceae bacterium]
MPVYWVREPGIRLRPVPELSCCLVYRRHPPALCGLNLTSWLALTLCDGRSEDEIADAYAAAVGARGPGTGRPILAAALQQLEALRLIRKKTGERMP